MSETLNSAIHVYRPGHPLPPGAADLFGHEATDAWAQPGDGVTGPVCVCAQGDDGEVYAGVFMIIEADAQTPVPPGSALDVPKLASVRQLLVRPEHRGKGLAGRLLRRAMGVANEAACTRIRSTAGWGCPDHLELYQRMRFERANPADRPYLVTRDLVAAV